MSHRREDIITIEVLAPEQLRTVFDLGNAAALGWEWEAYRAEMTKPHWAHYAIYRADEFCGCVSLELRNAVKVRYHISKRPRSVTPRQVRDLLWVIGGQLFRGGIQVIEAIIDQGNRASRRLALGCHLRRDGQTAEGERF